MYISSRTSRPLHPSLLSPETPNPSVKHQNTHTHTPYPLKIINKPSYNLNNDQSNALFENSLQARFLELLSNIFQALRLADT